MAPRKLCSHTATAPRRSSRITSQPGALAAPSTTLTKPPRPPRRKRTRQHGSPDQPAENSRPPKRRRHDASDELAEDAHPAKRRGQPTSPPAQLTKENLQKFNGDMASRSDATSVKRSASQRSMSDVSAPSQRSSGTLAFYRHHNLTSAMVFVLSRPPPAHILTNIDAIIKAPVSAKRREELVVISNNLCDAFADLLGAAAGEDDCLEPLHAVLSSMDHDRLFSFPRKADWRESLKPHVQKPLWDFQALAGDVQQHGAAVDSTSGPRRKRKGEVQRSSYISPTTSRTKTMEADRDTMPPPPPPPDNDNSSIKTPRPDITTGLRIAAVIKALESHGLSPTAANSLLDGLQQQTTNRGSPPEPLLCSEPTQRALCIRFPFLIVEGKSYATGKTVYEAQNQAAVSGACALKILHDLAEINAHAGGSDPKTAAPMVFSICTEGPHHELWCHYTTMQDGVRRFNMSILKTCHGSIPDGVLDFLVAVDNVIRWGASTFLDDIAKQLGNVAKSPLLRVCSY